MFCDLSKIRVIAGKGGNGAATFHREKFVIHGGPDGGDGGRGGDIYIIADPNVNTLTDINSSPIYRAECGTNGTKQKCRGADGKDITLKVPVGTIIKTMKNETIVDLKNTYDKFMIARGGIGGKGNVHFKSSVRQSPSFAEKGEPGEEKEIVLEVRLVADVGIIGLPSAGKSSFISIISNAKPKIADYPFTTLSPNLGVCNLKSVIGEQKSIVFEDIPGLIEGASQGKGLGHAFLRHIMRTRILVHVIDISLPDLVDAYKTINKELEIYGSDLDKKKQIVALNKVDLMPLEDAEKIAKEFHKKTKVKPILISCATGHGIPDLIKNVYKLYKKFIQEKADEQKKNPILDEEYRLFRPAEESDHYFRVIPKEETESGTVEIKGPRIEQLSQMTDFANTEAVSRLRHFIKKNGIEKTLSKMGVKDGDKVLIAGNYLIFRKVL
ncbi:MAG: GTPase ObgE [Candidatus Gracilibacteria bacterium]